MIFKIYCNVSLSEGGPISLLEAFSSGCIIFTTPTGLAFDLCVNDKLSHLMLFENQEINWFKKIEKAFENKNWNEIKTYDSWQIFKIMAEFVQAFENLAKIGPCVSIFGSARTKSNNIYYKIAEDIAYTALFLASEESKYITGQTITVDGGRVIN